MQARRVDRLVLAFDLVGIGLVPSDRVCRQRYRSPCTLVRL